MEPRADAHDSQVQKKNRQPRFLALWDVPGSVSTRNEEATGLEPLPFLEWVHHLGRRLLEQRQKSLGRKGGTRAPASLDKRREGLHGVGFPALLHGLASDLSGRRRRCPRRPSDDAQQSLGFNRHGFPLPHEWDGKKHKGTLTFHQGVGSVIIQALCPKNGLPTRESWLQLMKK